MWSCKDCVCSSCVECVLSGIRKAGLVILRESDEDERQQGQTDTHPDVQLVLCFIHTALLPLLLLLFARAPCWWEADWLWPQHSPPLTHSPGNEEEEEWSEGMRPSWLCCVTSSPCLAAVKVTHSAFTLSFCGFTRHIKSNQRLLWKRPEKLQ